MEISSIFQSLKASKDYFNTFSNYIVLFYMDIFLKHVQWNYKKIV